jgi:hypothetical protein
MSRLRRQNPPVGGLICQITIDSALGISRDNLRYRIKKYNIITRVASISR